MNHRKLWKSRGRLLRRTISLHFFFALAIVGSFAAEFAPGQVLCGYQGWFRCEGDGTGAGWQHYSTGRRFEPGACAIDLWPDTRELPAEARFPTAFRHADDSVAEVFTSAHPGTVRTHFRWMREYGIDGIFLQRFAIVTRDERTRKSMDDILQHVATSAKETSRVWAVMYDLTGLEAEQIDAVKTDWQRLDERFHLRTAGDHPTYLRHREKPLVALWGCGFSDRPAMLEQWRELIAFFKNDPQFGGCAVMLGVPAFWRTLNRDAIRDPALHSLVESVDIVSPWSVGRYRTPEEAANFATGTLAPDLAWCRERQLDYLPVVFPGFSWHNLSASRGQVAPFNAIPRLRGRFLWTQCLQARRAGAQSLYVAMFDELDEATAIFKTRNDPPVGASPFVAEPNLSTDHYLWLTGAAGRLVRGELSAQADDLPVRANGNVP